MLLIKQLHYPITLINIWFSVRDVLCPTLDSVDFLQYHNAQCTPRVFVKDFLSRDGGLHSRDHSPSPNHNARLFFNGFRITS